MDLDSCQCREISSDYEEPFFPKLFLHKFIYFTAGNYLETARLIQKFAHSVGSHSSTGEIKNS